MPRIPTALVAAGSLVAGYYVARTTGVRPLGGAVLVVGGVVCAREWLRTAGGPVTAVLVAVYAGGFVASHPLARVVEPWPGVLAVAAASGVAAYALADRRAPASARP